MAECPFIQRTGIIVSEFNEPVDYDGYVFYIHDDGFGKKTKVQHCQLIGRKRDVFECLNESEWKACHHYRFKMERLAEKAERS